MVQQWSPIECASRTVGFLGAVLLIPWLQFIVRLLLFRVREMELHIPASSSFDARSLVFVMREG